MGLYLGNTKVRVYLDGVAYYLNPFSSASIYVGVGLLSSDGFILKDANGLYLTTKEDE